MSAINYNSFLDNLIMLTLSILIPHYMVMLKVQNILGLNLTLIQTLWRFNMMVMIVVLLHISHYLRSRDLATIVIKKDMMEKSQI